LGFRFAVFEFPISIFQFRFSLFDFQFSVFDFGFSILDFGFGATRWERGPPARPSLPTSTPPAPCRHEAKHFGFWIFDSERSAGILLRFFCSGGL
jgi:hypothetical protein